MKLSFKVLPYEYTLIADPPYSIIECSRSLHHLTVFKDAGLKVVGNMNSLEVIRATLKVHLRSIP